MEIFDMSDDGSILVGRTGSFFTGFVGALWIERVGWMTWDDFFRKQGVVEASNIPFSNPISISGTGTEVVSGMVGASFSWLVNMNQVFVLPNARRDLRLGRWVVDCQGALLCNAGDLARTAANFSTLMQR